ncbi:MAG: hypothetical protein GXP44_00245 [bacterium]|nr:hypothetical protein [bacterium]
MDTNELLAKITDQILNPLIGLVIAVALMIFIWGVIEFIAGAANDEKRSKGKQHMVWGVIGLFIMVSVFGIMQILVNFWADIR